MLLAVDHEGQQFIDILFLISNDLQFRNLTVGENICKYTYWHSLDFRFSLSPSPVTNSTLPLQLSITSKNLFTSLIFCTFISIISFPFLRLHYTQENLYLQAFFPDPHPKIPFKIWENLDVFYSFRILFSVISIFFSFSR